jgi:hypothetical protein
MAIVHGKSRKKNVRTHKPILSLNFHGKANHQPFPLEAYHQKNAMLPQLVTSPELPSSIYGVFPSDFRADNSIIHDFLQPFQGDFPHFPDIFWLVVQ